MTIYLPAGVLAAARKRAREENRSLSAWVGTLIREAAAAEWPGSLVDLLHHGRGDIVEPDDPPATVSAARTMEGETVAKVCMKENRVKEILDYLNDAHVRCTYGAVGEVIEVPARFVGRRCLGERRKEASWVVRADTEEPTGYTDAEKHPRLKEREHIIRSGAELERCMRDYMAQRSACDPG